MAKIQTSFLRLCALCVSAFTSPEIPAKWYHANEIYDDESFGQRVYEIAPLLVMAKFVRLIERSLKAGETAKRIPVMASAHEMHGTLGRFEPPRE